MTYARLIDEAHIDARPPDRATFAGRLYTGDLSTVPGLLQSLSYYPVEESETPSASPSEGCHWEPRYAYDDAEAPTKIIETWVETQDPQPSPRTFSKLRVVQALMQEGVWPQVKAWIEQQGLYDLYLAAQVFSDDNPQYMAGLAALQQALGWSDEKVAALLDETEVR